MHALDPVRSYHSAGSTYRCYRSTYHVDLGTREQNAFTAQYLGTVCALYYLPLYICRWVLKYSWVLLKSDNILLWGAVLVLVVSNSCP